MIRPRLDKINALHSFMSATGHDPAYPSHLQPARSCSLAQLPCSISAPFAISLRVETLPSLNAVQGEARRGEARS